MRFDEQEKVSYSLYYNILVSYLKEILIIINTNKKLCCLHLLMWLIVMISYLSIFLMKSDLILNLILLKCRWNKKYYNYDFIA